MNTTTLPSPRSVSRRRFLGSSTAVAGSLVVGFHIPDSPLVSKALAQPASGEINAWVVIKPDDTVVVRIARSEMGQGTLTGLAQLVAEELECDWAKVTTEYPTPGQNVARNRVWQNFSTGGSRGIRESNDYVRKGGAAARMMLVQAAANSWSVPASECTVANSVVTHSKSGRSARYGQLAEAAAKLPAPAAADVALKDPSTWKIAGKPVARLDTRAKVDGSQVYGMDLKLPNMLNAAIKDCPVFGGKVEELRCGRRGQSARREEGGAGRRQCGRGGGRHLVARQDRARCADDRLGRRPERQDLEFRRGADAQGRPHRRRSGVGQQGGRREGRARRRHAHDRGGVFVPAPEPRLHGGDERHRAVHTAALRGVVPHAKRRGRVRGHGGGLGPAGGAGRGAQDPPRGWLRPPRHDRLRAPGGGHRQRNAGHADQADLVARRRHATRPLPSDHAVPPGGRDSTRTTTSPRCTCAYRGNRSSPPWRRRTCATASIRWCSRG